MKKNLIKILLATGVLCSFCTTTALAADNSAPTRTDTDRLKAAETLINGATDESDKKNFKFSIEGRYFAPHMDIKVQSDKIRYKDGSVGLKDDLGFGNDKAPEIILRYKRFTMDYIRVSGEGDREFTKANPLLFGGTKLRGNVHSKSEFHYLKLQITNPISEKWGSGFDWSYGLTGIYWKGKATGKAVSSNSSINGQTRTESEKAGAPVPTLGIGGHAKLWDNLNAYAHISGLPLGGYGHFYDFEAGIRYNPTDRLGIDIGYRKIHANIKHKNDHGTFNLQGPYAGIRYDF